MDPTQIAVPRSCAGTWSIADAVTADVTSLRGAGRFCLGWQERRCHDELGPRRQRASDADSLTLTAGELVRVPVVVLGVEPDQAQQILDCSLDALLG
jgi:hypothetical protein